MEITQIENDGLAIFLIILAVLIPISIIWITIRMFRKKRERGSEKDSKNFGDKFKSVKEDRLEKSGKKGK